MSKPTGYVDCRGRQIYQDEDDKLWVDITPTGAKVKHLKAMDVAKPPLPELPF